MTYRSLFRRVAVPLVMLAGAAALAPQANAQSPAPARAETLPATIVLPGATSAEGIAAGKGSTFYAGDLFAGDIFRGDVRARTAELFIDVPAGRQAVGMATSVKHDLLFVAGGFTGQAYVYDTRTGATVATYQLDDPQSSVINDVVVTRTGAWFTNSFQPKLYFVPIDGYGDLGPVSILELSGPAAEISGEFNLNGIQATANGKTLIVAHSTNAAVYAVDPATGASALIAGIDVPGVDGIVLRGHRLWAVQNINQVTRYRLDSELTSGVLEKTITSDLFQVPSTAALFGDTLAVVNAKFDTGIPPTADQYEVVPVRA